jgi:hypothetical protein
VGGDAGRIMQGFRHLGIEGLNAIFYSSFECKVSGVSVQDM